MRSSAWLPESARECTPSASMEEEPLNAKATNLAAAMARLALSAATIARVPPDTLIGAEVPSVGPGPVRCRVGRCGPTLLQPARDSARQAATMAGRSGRV